MTDIVYLVVEYSYDYDNDFTSVLGAFCSEDKAKAAVDILAEKEKSRIEFDNKLNEIGFDTDEYQNNSYRIQEVRIFDWLDQDDEEGDPVTGTFATCCM